MAIYDDPNWREGMSGKWKEMISKHRPDLCKAIDVDVFVDYLESMKVFNFRTCQQFKSTKGRYNQVSAILTALLKRPFEDFVKFCMALETAGQKHIFDQFFTLNRETPAPLSLPPLSLPPLSLPQQPSTGTDARPSEVEESTAADPLRSAWKDLIRNNYPSLVNNIDPDNGLMAQIISRKIIVEWMQDMFMSIEGRSRRAAAILDHLLLKRPYEDFLQFCESLKVTNQGHVVKDYLTLESRRRSNQSDCLGSSPYILDLTRSGSMVLDADTLSRLSDLDWKAVFVETRSILVDEVDASNEFINALFALGVFNSMSYEACVEKTEFFRMEFILDYMRRRPDEDFIKFCTALAKTNQPHIIDNFFKHKIEKQTLPRSPESSLSVPQMGSGERLANHHVIIAQPEEATTSIAANPCVEDPRAPESRMEVEEFGTSTSIVCQPQDDDISTERHHHQVVSYAHHPTQLRNEVSTFMTSEDNIPMDQGHGVLPDHFLHPQSYQENYDDQGQGPSDIIHVKVRHCSEQFYQQHQGDAYAMSRQIRGFCVIVNIKFVRGLNPRVGTETDGVLLTTLFKGLHFEVMEIKDLTATGIKETIATIASDERLRDHQCFVLFVLSHGEIDSIYGSDGEKIAVSDILEPLTDARCPNLVRKPRIVFFQACRGKYHQTQTDAPSPPVYRDFVIGFPTQREFVSFRNTELGSWYINALVKVFMEKAHQTSLSELLNMVSGRISRWSTETTDKRLEGQSSTYESHLTKSFYFFPGIVR